MNKLISYAHFYDLYALLAFVCIFIIGPFGIYPATSSYIKKLSLAKELESEELLIDQALMDARDLRYLNEDIAPFLQGLDKAIPTGFSGEEFVLEIFSITTRNGFLLRSINFSPDKATNSISVSISADGEFSDIENLSKDLENSSFSVIIDSFAISFPQKDGNADQVLSMQLKVFSLLEEIQ